MNTRTTCSGRVAALTTALHRGGRGEEVAMPWDVFHVVPSVRQSTDCIR